jgi:hypothetical protein
LELLAWVSQRDWIWGAMPGSRDGTVWRIGREGGV